MSSFITGVISQVLNLVMVIIFNHNNYEVIETSKNAAQNDFLHTEENRILCI